MDNLTHSLIGIAAAETFLCATRARAGTGERATVANPQTGDHGVDRNVSRLRLAVLFTAILGNNFPDFDFIYNLLGIDGKLGYLLEHRGHTHTFLFAIPLGLIAGWLGKLIARVPWRSIETRGLLALGVFSTFLHITADAWNDYGVHPFFPLSNRWLYGDFIFIVEPMLWAILVPLAVSRLQSWIARGFWAVFGVAALGLVWFGPFTSMAVAIAVTLLAGGQFAMHRMAKGSGFDRRLMISLASFALVLAIFATASRIAKRRVRAELVAHSPREIEIDLVTSPAPGNPFCWRVLTVSHEGGARSETDPARTGGIAASGELVLRAGVASLWPSVTDPRRCYAGAADPRTADLKAGWPSGEAFFWVGEFKGDLGRLRQLAEQDCNIAAFLRFARAPFWIERPASTIVGDLRYDRGPGIDFAEIETTPGPGNPGSPGSPAHQRCMQFEPRWWTAARALIYPEH